MQLVINKSEMTLTDVQIIQKELLKNVVRVCDENDLTYYAAYGTALGAIRHKGFIPWDGDVDIYVPENELSHFIDTMNKKLPDKYWVDFQSDKKQPRDLPRIGLSGYETGVIHCDVFRLSGMPESVSSQKRHAFKMGLVHHINDLKEKGLNNYISKRKKIPQAIFLYLVTLLFPKRVTTGWTDKLANKYPFDSSVFVGDSVTSNVRYVFPKKYLGKGVEVPFEDFHLRVPEYFNEYLQRMYGDYKKFPSEEEIQREINRVFYIGKRLTKDGLIKIHYKY